jgi:hypothetical protein
VKQAIEHGRTPKVVRSIRRLLATTARSVSRYAILEPNISGIGINLNRALDDLADQLDPPHSKSTRPAQLNQKTQDFR